MDKKNKKQNLHIRSYPIPRVVEIVLLTMPEGAKILRFYTKTERGRDNYYCSAWVDLEKPTTQRSVFIDGDGPIPEGSTYIGSVTANGYHSWHLFDMGEKTQPAIKYPTPKSFVKTTI